MYGMICCTGPALTDSVDKKTQTIYIEYLCGCSYLKICADQRQRPKVMTTHRPVIDGQPRRIIEKRS